MTEQLNFKLPHVFAYVCVCVCKVQDKFGSQKICVCLKSLNLLTELMRKVRLKKDKGKVKPDGKVSVQIATTEDKNKKKKTKTRQRNKLQFFKELPYLYYAM